MKNTKDLSWLSAPAFFLILGIIFFNAIKQSNHIIQPEKTHLHKIVR